MSMTSAKASTIDRTGRVEATIGRIVDTAFELMLKHHIEKLTIAEISRVSSISRPTIYRHFSNLEAIHEAVFRRVRNEFDRGMNDAIAANPKVEARIEVVADYMALFAQSRYPQQLSKTNPDFALELVTRFFDSRTDLYERALAPLFDMAETVSGRPLDRRFAAELLNHYYISLNLTAFNQPADAIGGKLRKQIRTILHAYKDTESGASG
jgi:AcrR family transcriptional regulator